MTTIVPVAQRAVMIPSTRGTSLPSSPIRGLIPLAAAAKARGTRVHQLNIGNPDFAPPPSLTAALGAAHRARLDYAPTRGLPEAVEAWRVYYRRHGVALEADDILVTSGSSEALSLAFLTTCDPGDDILVPDPFYAPYRGIAAVAGLRLVPVPLGDGFVPPSIEAIRARVTPRTRALLLCSPNNPTGTLWSRDDLAALGALAVEAGFFILSDETYREIVLDGPPAPSALAIAGAEEHVVVIDSVSKRFSAPGLRIGSLVSRNRGVMDAALRVAELRLSAPTIDQLAVVGPLTESRSYIEEVVAAYRKRRDAVVAGLNRIPGVQCHRPPGAFYVVARLPVDDALDFCAWLLRDFALRDETVVLTPMTDFYATPGRGRDEVRIACVHDVETLTRAVEIVGAGLAAYPGRV